jgi:acylphosphatase
MKTVPVVSVVLALVVLRPGVAFSAEPAGAAVSGLVSGKVQKVGFRALILKQAIRFNLAGTAKNNPDSTVSFVLQGDPDRITEAVKVIAKGTDKSSDVKVETNPTKVERKLKTFTVLGSTSTSRHITTPYDLVFTLRKDGKEVSEKEAHNEYHSILKKTLNKDDRKKAGLE